MLNSHQSSCSFPFRNRCTCPTCLSQGEDLQQATPKAPSSGAERVGAHAPFSQCRGAHADPSCLRGALLQLRKPFAIHLPHEARPLPLLLLLLPPAPAPVLPPAPGMAQTPSLHTGAAALPFVLPPLLLPLPSPPLACLEGPDASPADAPLPPQKARVQKPETKEPPPAPFLPADQGSASFGCSRSKQKKERLQPKRNLSRCMQARWWACRTQHTVCGPPALLTWAEHVADPQAHIAEGARPVNVCGRGESAGSRSRVLRAPSRAIGAQQTTS